MTWNLTNGLTQLFGELGITIGGGKDMTTDLKNATINDCSAVGGDQTLPISLIAWDGYDHSAGPAAPGGFTFNPGSTTSQDGTTTQDTDVYIEWNAVTCAASYDVLSATSCGGTYSVISNDQSDEFLSWAGVADNNGTSTWIKVRGVSNTGDNGTLTSCLEVKSAPTKPVSPSVSVDETDCDNVLCTMNWTNGTSPGTRRSKISYRWTKNGTPAGAYTTEVASYGDTSYQVNVGAGVDTDDFSFEWYYHEEGSSQTVTATSPEIACVV
jgi:hypothetical protein